jgi:hypothetical protein
MPTQPPGFTAFNTSDIAAAQLLLDDPRHTIPAKKLPPQKQDLPEDHLPAKRLLPAHLVNMPRKAGASASSRASKQRAMFSPPASNGHFDKSLRSLAAELSGQCRALREALNAWRSGSAFLAAPKPAIHLTNLLANAIALVPDIRKALNEALHPARQLPFASHEKLASFGAQLDALLSALHQASNLRDHSLGSLAEHIEKIEHRLATLEHEVRKLNTLLEKLDRAQSNTNSPERRQVVDLSPPVSA